MDSLEILILNDFGAYVVAAENNFTVNILGTLCGGMRKSSPRSGGCQQSGCPPCL